MRGLLHSRGFRMNRRDHMFAKAVLVVTLACLVVLLLALICLAHAETIWTVEYFQTTSIDQTTHWYGPGTYLFLLRPEYMARSGM